MAFGMSPFPLRFGSRQGGGGFTPHFWVDSTNGDDGNDGTSAEAAFQTLGAAKTAVTARSGALTRVGLVADSVFAGGNDWSALDNVQIRGVGEGRMPEITSVEVEDTWTSDSSVYKVTWTQTAPTASAGTSGPSVFEDGVLLLRVSSLATCQSTAGSFYAANVATESGTTDLYVHASDSGNPNSNGKVYEVTTEYCALHLGDDCLVDGVHLRGSAWKDGVIRFGRRATLTGCLVRDILMHGTFAASWKRWHGNVLYGFDRDASVAGSLGNAIIGYNGGETGEPNNISGGWVAAAVAAPDTSGLYCHGQSERYTFTELNVSDMVFARLSAAISGAQTEVANIADVLSYNCGTGFSPNPSETASIPVWNVDKFEYYFDGTLSFTYEYASRLIATPYMEVNISNSVLNAAKTLWYWRLLPETPLTFENCLLIQRTALNNQIAIAADLQTDGALTMTNTAVYGFNDNANVWGILISNASSDPDYTGAGNLYITSRNSGDTRMKFRLNGTDPALNTPTLWLADQQPANEVGSATTTVEQFSGDVTAREYGFVAEGVADTMGVGPQGFDPKDISNLATLEAAWAAGYLGIDGSFPPE